MINNLRIISEIEIESWIGIIIILVISGIVIFTAYSAYKKLVIIEEANRLYFERDILEIQKHQQK